MGKGFERCFETIEDLEIDVPGASHVVASFLARAIVDGEALCLFNRKTSLTRQIAEILPPSFLVDPVVVGLGGEVVAQTKRMLSRDHQHSHIEKIWGPGDGRPVAELKVFFLCIAFIYVHSSPLTNVRIDI